MKLKRARIIVEPLEKTKARWARALAGKLKSNPNEEVISVGSLEILGKILSPPRMAILWSIPVLKPASISALAKELRKDFKNVYSDVKFLAELGLIELKEIGKGRKTLVPIPLFDEIELPLSA